MTATRVYWALSLTVLVVLAYLPVLVADEVSNPDAQYLLRSLLENKSYFSDLVNWRSLDVQPVRDLSFFLDLKVFQFTGINIILWQNAFWWIGICWLLYLLARDKAELPLLGALLCGFAVYPLFATVLPWGMARKHLLSAFFILAASLLVMRKKYDSRLILLYLLSVFSQPITLLWPVWAIVVVRPRNRKLWPLFGGLLFLMLLTAVINFAYYRLSPVYLSVYAAKATDPFNIPDKLLALGHYYFQLLLPYRPSYRYDLGDWATMVGLALSIVGGFLVYRLKVFEGSRHWMVFAALPLLMVLIDSGHLFDTYLILPAAGIFLGIVLPVLGQSRKKALIALSLVLLVWTPLTAFYSSHWQSDQKLMKMSFENRPNCINAISLLKVSYENRITDAVARDFVLSRQCPMNRDIQLLLRTYMLYSEVSRPLEERLGELGFLARESFLAHAAHASLLIQEKRYEEAGTVIKEMVGRWGRIRFAKEYTHIVADFLYPYCVEKKQAECITLSQPFIERPQPIFYR